jgi:hypothetical protein
MLDTLVHQNNQPVCIASCVASLMDIPIVAFAGQAHH